MEIVKRNLTLKTASGIKPGAVFDGHRDKIDKFFEKRKKHLLYRCGAVK